MNTKELVENFRRNNIGFFIHYGPYNFLEKGEWYMKMNNFNERDYYDKLGLEEKTFDINFDKILPLMKANGFNYAILTTKHHDGFCLFDSKGLSKYDINMTKNKRDVVKNFVDKCIKYKIEPILYYATLDWTRGDFEDNFDTYLDYIYNSVELLCDTYKGIKGFWFDGNWSKPNGDWKLDRLYGMIKSKVKDSVIINNSGMEETGIEQHKLVDSITFEQGLITPIDYNSFSRPLFSEVCQSFNDHWGYSKYDYNFKSLEYLILKYLESKKIKANYVLNISIDKKGEMLGIEIETIKLFYDWIKKYGSIFYKDYEILEIKKDGDFVVKQENNIFIFLYGIYSGGHVKKIHDGGGIQKNRTYSMYENIKNLIYVDNNKKVLCKDNKRKLIITPHSFDYGVNTIVRVIKGEI